MSFLYERIILIDFYIDQYNNISCENMVLKGYSTNKNNEIVNKIDKKTQKLHYFMINKINYRYIFSLINEKDKN